MIEYRGELVGFGARCKSGEAARSPLAAQIAGFSDTSYSPLNDHNLVDLRVELGIQCIIQQRTLFSSARTSS
jgi:hypothetical protein